MATQAEGGLRGFVAGIVDLDAPAKLGGLRDLDVQAPVVAGDGVAEEQVCPAAEGDYGSGGVLEDADGTGLAEGAVVEACAPAVVEAGDGDREC